MLKNLLPELKIQIGSSEVPVIHTHTVDFTSPVGPQMDGLDVSIFFSTDVHFFGKPLAEAPSPANQISCTDLPRGMNCKLSSIKPGGGRYRITMATDQKQPPNVDSADKGIKLIQAETYISASEPLWPAVGGIFVGLAGMFVAWFSSELYFKSKRAATERKLEEVATKLIRIQTVRSSKRPKDD